MTDTGTRCILMSSKTRVAPTSQQTIPRLELLSALLLARLMASISKNLEKTLEKPICYMDSKVALYWILGLNKDWRPFVQHHVEKIRRLIPSTCWRHCPGMVNPADLPSRGLKPDELEKNKDWFKGPDWLTTDLNGEKASFEDMPSECIQELRACEKKTLGMIVAASGLSQIINIQKYSCLGRVLRVTCHMLTFIARLRRMTASTVMLQAEVLWLREVQSSFQTERKFSDWKVQLGLFSDQNGLWRCRGRIQNANARYEIKHPILLPAGNYFTLLVIREAHEIVFHSGVKQTLTELRSKYWIVRGRSVVKKMIYRCVTCRRFEARPYKAPDPPPLPRIRVEEAPPFTYTGVDFAGPIYTKDGTGKVSLKRFTSRRGIPHKFISDNGKTFKATAKKIKKIMNHPEAIDYVNESKTEWRSEYLLELREQHRYSKGDNAGVEIKVGDIVIVKSNEKRHGFWNLGKVESIIPERDGLIRGATVRVATGGRKSTLLNRPVQHLYPMEINHQEEESSQDQPRESQDHKETARPRRAAAFEARDRIIAQTLDD
uniref:DUF5641 domain-containing protein n=1 Tax=Amphimedon queenslandica TaxID=400682 RepID=A0A1X7TD41_AMPQE